MPDAAPQANTPQASKPKANAIIAPLAVEVMRGAVVESRHRASCAVADAEGRLVHGWGDVERAVYPRSAIKAIQALPLVESGAAEAFGLGDAEIALACASHGAEPFHVAVVEAWLARIGLTEADLECGAHLPSYRPAAKALLGGSGGPNQMHNNCSGKHLAMLTTARHMGEPVAGYIKADHPVQKRVAAIIGEISGVDMGRAAVAVDGCGIPTIALPLGGLAVAMARFAAPDGLEPARSTAIRRIHTAIAARPEMVAGTGRFCSAVIAESGGKLLVKTGAEGVFCAALPGRGLGIAVKVDDGAGRAAEVAMAAVLREIGAMDDALAARLADYLVAPLTNHAGLRIGEVRPAPNWPK